MSGKPLTGRKVLAITVAAFSVIIGVNGIMAWSAIRTFPGLEVENTYVASQNFDANRAAQEALGWDVSATLEGGELVLSIMDRDGLPAEVAQLDATVGRATHVREDRAPRFVRRGGVYRAPVDLAPGNWNLRLKAVAADGTAFRQRIALYVSAD